MFRVFTILALAALSGLFTGLWLQKCADSQNNEIGSVVNQVEKRGRNPKPSDLPQTKSSIFELFRSLGPQELSAALPLIKSFDRPSQQQHAIAAYLTTLAEAAPEMVVDVVSTTEVDSLIVIAVFESIAHNDAPLAILLASKLSSAEQNAALKGVARVLVGQPMDSTREVLDSIRAEEDLHNQLKSELATLLSTAEDAELIGSGFLDFAKVSPSDVRNEMLCNIAERFPKLAFELWNSGEFSDACDQEQILAIVAHASPEGLIYIANQFSDPAQIMITMFKASPTLNAEDIAQISDLVDDPVLRKKLMGWSLAHMHSHSSIAAVVASLSETALSSAEFREFLGEGVDQALRSQRFDVAWELARSNDLGQEEKLKVISKYTHYDPTIAIALIEENKLYDPIAVSNVVGIWSGSDPKGAAVWLSENASKIGEQNTAYEYLADMWSRMDSYKASEWIATLPKGIHRDQAIFGMLGNISNIDFDAAQAWADTIEDSKIAADAQIRLKE